VAIKLAMAGVSPVTQAAIRSIVATLLLLGWARLRGIPLWQPTHARDGTLIAGLVAGLLFAAEFVFIYSGLAHTTASRMVVFVYLAPILTALGLAWLVPGEKLAPVQWGGVLVAFAGLALAFIDGLAASNRATLLGDSFGVLAALLWAPAPRWCCSISLPSRRWSCRWRPGCWASRAWSGSMRWSSAACCSSR
jgi:drug/metabolite transporter (DMT)-like permease